MYKTTVLFLSFIINASCFSQDFTPIASLQTEDKGITFNQESEYRLSLYESLYKKWSLHLSGKVSPDYDIFGNELKTNVFTTVGVDF